jgi:hypothetical protein
LRLLASCAPTTSSHGKRELESAEPISIVVGIALVLTGVGLVILALAVFGRTGPEAKAPAGV